MKKIKLLLAVVAVIALLSTAVFAAEGTIFDIDDTTAVLNEGSVALKITTLNTVEISAGGGFKFNYDAEVWDYVSYEHGKTQDLDPTAAAEGLVWVSFNPNANVALTAGDVLGVLTLKLKDGKTVADDTTGITVCTDEWVLMDKDYSVLMPSDTVFVTAGGSGDPVAPEGVSTTYTLNGKAYKDVPNKTVTVNNVTAAETLNGTVTATYWTAEKGEGNTKTFSFTTSAPNITGGGNVSFDVAIMEVPSYVVITDIAAAFN